MRDFQSCRFGSNPNYCSNFPESKTNMSEELLTTSFRVPVTKIKEVMKHPNADRLSIYKVFDFNVVGGLDQYAVGQTCVYVPIDAILSQWLEEKLFRPDSKIKLTKSRIKQIRIRGAVSQGMLITMDDVKEKLKKIPDEADDISELLGITKYEPPTPSFQQNDKGPKSRNKPKENPYFHKYDGLQNYKYYNELFVEGQPVVYEEKIHGTHLRAGKLPFVAKTWWEKVKGYFGFNPEFEFCWGSNNVQLQQRKKYKGYYEDDIYTKAVKKYGLELALNKNEVVYCELFGPGIQKDYDYGLTEHQIVVFDIKVLADDRKSWRWLTVDEKSAWCQETGLPQTPILYRGPHFKDLAYTYTKGSSTIGTQKIREGIVIRDPAETTSYMGKKFVKYISEDYLDLDNTDFH